MQPVQSLTCALQSLSEEPSEQSVAVLTHGGFGVAVDVEGVRDLWTAPVTIPDPQPHRGLRPGRRSGGGFGLADLESDKWQKTSAFPI